MKINRSELICGVRPSALRALLKQGDFDTPAAMKRLSLAEPHASACLTALAKAQWIGFDGTINFVDQWKVRSKGTRFCATRLGKRFPIDEGREIVARIVSEARAINNAQVYSKYVIDIFLFGSVLTGAEGSDVGDVDLVAVLADRVLSADDRDVVKRAEDDLMPAGVASHIVKSIFWPEMRVLQRLKAVSRKASFHGFADLETTGCQFRSCYSFDAASQTEVPFDTTIRSLPRVSSSLDEDTSTALPSSIACTRPVAFPDGDADEASMHASMTHRAEHMWTNGASIDVIAYTTGEKPDDVLQWLKTC